MTLKMQLGCRCLFCNVGKQAYFGCWHYQLNYTDTMVAYRPHVYCKKI